MQLSITRFRTVTTGVLTGAIAVATSACSDSRLEAVDGYRARFGARNHQRGDIRRFPRTRLQAGLLLAPEQEGERTRREHPVRQPQGAKAAADSTVIRGATTPIVIVDGKVLGWGWTYYDSLAAANNIPLAAK